VTTKSKFEILDELRIEIRSIHRQWDSLRQPLKAIDMGDKTPEGTPRFRINAMNAYEEILDQYLRLSGSIWQLKDRFKLLFELAKLSLGEVDKSGRRIAVTIEQYAAKSLNLMICADLTNEKKHGENKNRSGFSPRLNGVQLMPPSGRLSGISYDGASKMGVICVPQQSEIPYQVEVVSGDGQYSFGTAIVLAARGFAYWIPLIRQLMRLESDHPEWAPIVPMLDSVEQFVATCGTQGSSN
jgi:hypothetical protein